MWFGFPPIRGRLGSHGGRFQQDSRNRGLFLVCSWSGFSCCPPDRDHTGSRMGNEASSAASSAQESLSNSFTLPNSRGGNIFCREFPPKTEPKVLMVYMHGLFLHSSVPINVQVCEDFAATGVHVVAFDHTGHGRYTNPYRLINHLLF